MRKNLLLTFTTLCIILFSGGNISSQASYYGYADKDYYQQGDEYRKKGKNKEALTCYQTLLAYEPDNYSSQIMAAITCKDLDLYASAIHYFEQGVKSSGGSASYGNLGSIYAEMGYDEEATEKLEHALSMSPNYAFPLNNMGALLMRYGNYDKARVYLRKAMKSNNEMPDAPFNIGLTYYETDKLDSALVYFDKTLEVNPNYLKAYMAKAIVLKKMGKPQEEYEPLCNKAIMIYSNVLKNDPDNFRALSVRADAYEILGIEKNKKEDLERKLRKLNQLIELHPRAYTFIESRGNTYRNLENNEAAIKDYQRVIELNPEYEYVKNKLRELQAK